MTSNFRDSSKDCYCSRWKLSRPITQAIQEDLPSSEDHGRVISECCDGHSGKPNLEAALPGAILSSCFGNSCCESDSSAEHINPGPIPKSLEVEECLKHRCHGGGENTPVIEGCVEDGNCRRRRRGSEGSGKRDSHAPDIENSSRSSCCSATVSLAPSTPVVDDCLKKECCSHITSCHSTTDIQSSSPGPPGHQDSSSSSRLTFTSEVEKVDPERDLYGVQHIMLQVQGMTCTGCEKKLYRLLTSLPEVSHVKTSLLLAQAEFDLRLSAFVDADNIASILQKMTGFTCTKIVHFGEELELIVEGNAQDFTDQLPSQITDLTVINKSRIRVSYRPKVIGARSLLSNPFFRFATLAPPSLPPSIAFGRAHLWRSFYITIFSAVCTMPVLILAWAKLPKHEVTYGAISLVLATIVQVIVAGPFYDAALKALIFSRMIEMDFLIVMSTTTAYLYSIIAYAYLAAGERLATGEFFETSTLLITLIMVGRTVSAFARQRAVESITIESLQTKTAILVDPQSQEEMEIDARLLQYGDIFKVLPDMSVVTDGIIISGGSEVDESLITGEATLMSKRPGDAVIAGSINHSGALKVRLTHLPCENTIKTIGAMVDQAKLSKPKIQELADRVAGYFVPAMLAATIIVFVTWVAIGRVIRNQSTTTSCINAMTYSISVLIVSCPCAIGLAVPMVVVIAGGVGARHGLVFKTAETIESARKLTHVIFDKTGTLTQGKLHVVVKEFLNRASEANASLILGLTTNSKHPVSTAIAAHLRSSGIQSSVIDQVVSVPGSGIEATLNGLKIRAGNPYWLNVQDHPSVCKMLSLGLTNFCITVNGTLIAVFGLQDALRPDAISTINELKRRSIEISLLSGDNDASVQALASQLSIPISNTRSRCTPSQKAAYVKSLLLTTSPTPTILFCGDGTNDAVALAQATIGVHINEGDTEVAQSAADAVLMRPSLKGILTLINLSDAVHKRVMFNFAWSAVYNLAAVLLAAGAFPGVRISPQYAGLGEVVSVLPVVLVGFSLRWWMRFSY